jgi:hypothetical protein
MVQGFLSAVITPTGEDSWQISNYGSMQTLRIDSSGMRPNLGGSTNVVGYRQVNGSLYVFIGQGEQAHLVLEQTAAPVPHLEYCGCIVKSRVVAGETEAFAVNTRLETDFRLAEIQPNTRVTFGIEGTTSATVDVVAGPEGKVSVRLPKGTYTIEVRGHLEPT